MKWILKTPSLSPIFSFKTKRPGKKEVAVVRALYDYTASNPDELSFTCDSVL
jgi:hypothetical protein